MRNGLKVFDADAHVVEREFERFAKLRVAYNLIQELGDDHIVWESDYPHTDSRYPHAVEKFLEMPKVSDESKRKILWDNTTELYRFPPDCLPEEFDEATGGD